MKRLILFLLIILVAGNGFAQNSRLQQQGLATQLIVDGSPFLIVGGELGNSSAACVQDLSLIHI